MKQIIPKEEKLRMVRMLKKGLSVPEVCEQEGVSRSALYRWKQLYENHSRWSTKKIINLQQVYQMERRLAILEEEIQIFRKSGCGTKSSIDEKIAAIEALNRDTYTDDEVRAYAASGNVDTFPKSIPLVKRIIFH